MNADQLGFVMGLGAVAAVAIASWANAPVGAASRTSGVIQELNLAARECPCVRVGIDDGVTHGVAIVREPSLRACRVGDRIPLDRRKAPVGFRYSFPPGGCRWR